MLSSDTAQGYFLLLIRSALNKTVPLEKPEAVSFDEVYRISCRQSMSATAFCAADMLKNKPEGTLYEKWRNKFLEETTKSDFQLRQADELIKRLCVAGIEIIPLKGIEIKKLYPASCFRTMSDVDFFYRTDNSERFRKLMEAQGYTTVSWLKGNHDVFYRMPIMNVEAHRTLTAPESPYFSLSKTIIEHAVPDTACPNLLHLTAEDLYLHVIIHAAKHFKSTGCGVRVVADISVLNNRYGKNFNNGYINEKLKLCGLLKFHSRLEDLAALWFGDGNASFTPDTERFFLSGSVYGEKNDRRNFAMEIASDEKKYLFAKKLKSLLNRIFLPRKSLCSIYPVLRKYPCLTPLFVIYRWFDRLFRKPKRFAEILSGLSSIEQSEIDGIAGAVREMGLTEK